MTYMSILDGHRWKTTNYFVLESGLFLSDAGEFVRHCPAIEPEDALPAAITQAITQARRPFLRGQ